MRTTFDVTLHAPQKVLYDYLGNPANRSEWQSSIIDLEVLTPGPTEVGTRWREQAKGFGEFEMHISEMEPPNIWAERGSSNRGSMMLRLVFSSEDEARTHLRVEVELNLKGVLGLLQYGAPLVLAPLMKADLRRAAQLCTGQQ